MIKVCHNSGSTIYEDGDNWVWKAEGKNDIVYDKAHNPLFPLAAVIKYEMISDNENILEELRRKSKLIN